MSTIAFQSYNVIINRLKAFADGYEMINSFSHGLLSLVDLPKDKLYPAMHVIPGDVLIGKGQRTYTFDVIFFDKPRAHEEEPEYQREVISDCIRLAENLIYEINNGYHLFGKDVFVNFDNTISPFIESYSQVVTGVTLSNIQITVQNDWNACDLPANWSVGGSSSGGSGSSTGLVLKTNGTTNAVQSLLDLVQGSNITITDLGDGRVRISATGGGGGSVDWGSIGGTLSAQTDLQAALNGRATDAELTAEASARASADTTLQNNINTLSGALSTETTARMAGDATNAADLSAHTSNTNNPHNTTKTQVGLGNVDNTSDADKPISSATQTALNAKEPTITAGTTSQYYRGDKTFQTLDKAAVGLANIDNTSDADKPVSTAQGVAIGAKQDTLVSSTNIKTINGNSILGSGDLSSYHALRATSSGLTLASGSGDRFIGLTSMLNGGTESPAQIAAEYAMVFTRMVIRTTTTQNVGGSLVFTLRKNGVDTALVVTIAAGATANVFAANGSVSFAQGDLISIKARNNAAATSANVVQMSNMYTT